jgi:hypothetical protein
VRGAELSLHFHHYTELISQLEAGLIVSALSQEKLINRGESSVTRVASRRKTPKSFQTPTVVVRQPVVG